MSEDNNHQKDFFRELKKMIKEIVENTKFEPTPAICPKCNSKFYDFDLLLQHHEKDHIEFLNWFYEHTKDRNMNDRLEIFYLLHDEEAMILLRHLAE